MAVSNEDLARLIVTLEATTTRYSNELRKAQQQTNNTATGIERRLTSMSTRIDKTFANLGNRLASNITGPLAGVGAALSTREIIRYADAWTEATNSIAASSDITGIQGRSLQDLRTLADESRAGFTETVKLYTRIQRSAGAVANSEEELARATSIVNKAFKAGGAASSEMAAGILQLSQGLGSGYLQGDELRSVRENAPVLAKVIADYFGVTIAGLKELGSEGKLTSDLVFKAILSGEAQIASAFAKTNATISDGFTRVKNALIEYIGSADQSSGVTVALNAGLNALADNIETVGDGVLKLAALIAGILVGRSLVSMIGTTLAAAEAFKALTLGMAAVTASGRTLSTTLTTAFGPIAAIVGGIALVAFQELASQSLESSTNIRSITEEMESLGIISRDTTSEIREQARATDELTEAQKRLNAAQKNRDVDRVLRAESDIRFGNFTDNLLGSQGGPFTTAIEELKSFNTVALRSKEAANDIFSGLDQGSRNALTRISELAFGLRDGTEETKNVVAELRTLQQLPLDVSILPFIDSLDRLTIEFDQVIAKQRQLGTSTDLVNLRNEISASIDLVGDLSLAYDEFTSEDEKIAFEKRVEELSERVKEGTITVEDAHAELTALAGISATFSGYLSGLEALFNKLKEVSAEAQKVNSLNFTASPGDNRDRGAPARARKERLEREEAQRKFIQGQKDFNSLSKEERDIRNEIDSLVKNAAKEGTSFKGDVYQNSELRALAAQNLALKESEKKGSKSEGDKFSDYLKNKQLEIEAAEAELAIREKLNPLIEDYGYELSKQEFKQNALNEAKKRGQILDEDALKALDIMAERWATVQAAQEKLTETQNNLRESTREWFELGKSATRSFIDDLIEGKTAAEALGNALSQLGSKLIDLGLNSIFGTGSGGNAFGLLGQLFGIGGIPGRASGGPVRAGQPYVVGEKRPELFVPNQDGVIIPRLPSSTSSSGNISTPVQISIDARGADGEGMIRVEQQLIKLKAELPYVIRSEVQKRQKKGW